MNNGLPESKDDASTSGPDEKNAALSDFLYKRKLQISVLKKMLAKIPVDKADPDDPENEHLNETDKENQNP